MTVVGAAMGLAAGISFCAELNEKVGAGELTASAVVVGTG